jgi:Na+-driven multidrug efflux pump
VARARANDGNRAASRVAIRYIAFGATLLMPYFLVIALFPTQLLKFFYGADSPYVNEGQWLRLFVANYTAVYLLSTINAWLAALGHSRWNFYSQVVNIVITISMSLPLIYWLGVPGVIIGGLLSVIGTGAVTGYFIRRAAYTAPDDPETTSQTVVIPPEA